MSSNASGAPFASEFGTAPESKNSSDTSITAQAGSEAQTETGGKTIKGRKIIDPRGEKPLTYTVTTAHASHTDDVNARMIKYSISMGIRMVCIILAVYTEGFWRWAFTAGAVLLPYFAVVAANAGRESNNAQATFNQASENSFSLEADTRSVRSSEDAHSFQTPNQETVIIQGEVIVDSQERK